MQGIPNDLTSTLGGDPDEAGMELLAPGTRLSDRYDVRRVIDWGGYAVVYHAHDRELNRDIALKVLRRHRESKEGLIRFRREVAVAREAASPHLVRVFDLENSDGAVYLTMELIDGESLRKRMERGPLPVETIIRISTEILEALSSLHALGIIHRDIKPGNVLIDSSDRVKVTDFGLARQLASGDQSATATGALMGTIAYISPEQALGSEADTRSDLYAAGVVMFEMLAGRVPHEAKSALGSLLMRTRRRPADVRSIRRDCPRWLAQIVLRLLEPRPEDRYGTASETLADLRRRKGRPSPMRVRRLMTAAGLLVIVSAGLTFTARWWPVQPQFSNLVPAGSGVAAVGGPGAFSLSNDPPACDRQSPVGPALQLRWTASSGATSYAVHRDGSPTGGGVRLTGTSYYNSLALVAGREYSYFIRASDARGTRDSNTIRVAVSANICD